MKDRITVDGVNYVRATSTPADAPPGLSYAIVRSREQGVMCGYVERVDGRCVTLRLARQMWSWRSSFVLPDAATTGVDKTKCKFSIEMSEPAIMLEACGILYCSPTATAQLRAVPGQVMK